MKNFYLIDSPKINELNKAGKDFLDKHLVIYHTHSSSVIDKAEAIHALVDQDDFKKLRFEYNAWLFDFVNYQLKTLKTEGENEALEKILAYCYYVFGAKNYTEDNSKNALDNFKKAIKIGEKLKDSRGLFRTYFYVAFMHDVSGDLSKALKFYEKCLKLSRENVNKTSLAGVFNNLYFMLRNKGNYLKSSSYLFKALSIYKEINDEAGMAMMYHNIGDSFLSQLEIDEALKYFFVSVKLSESSSANAVQIATCVEIGSICQGKGENDIALKYYLRAVNLQEINHKYNYAYYRLGTLYEDQNQIDLAMDYYNKSLQLSERTGSKKLLSETLSKIGALEIKRGNVEKAAIQIKNAFELAQELNYSEPIRDAAAAKLHLAIAIEDYKLAFEMEKLKNEMKEKIQNKDNFKMMIRHQLKYEYEKQLKQKDIEIEKEKQNNLNLKEQIDILSAKNKLLIAKNNIINEQLEDV